jgi:signal transduction histidine kinase
LQELQVGAEKDTRHFPVWWLLLAVVVTGAMFAWLGWHVFFTHGEFEEFSVSSEQIRHRAQEAKELNLQLSFYVQLSATTGWRWAQDAYHKELNELEQLLGKTISGRSWSVLIEDDAYRDLRYLEQEALALATEEKRQIALNRVFSERYSHLQNLLAERFEQFRKRELNMLMDHFEALKRHDFLSLSIALFIFLVSISAWVYLVLRARVWQLELRKEAKRRHAAEVQLIEAQKHEAISHLVSGIVHDFGNLITAISGYAHLAKKSLVPGGKVVKSLDQILIAADQASEVTAALISLGKATPPVRRVENVARLVGETVEMLRDILPAVIQLSVKADDPDSCWAEVNSGQMQQLIVNLILNARDAMEEGGVLELVVKSVGLDAESSRTGYVQLIVTDSGSGIPSEDIPRIFDPYFSTKPRAQGTGLGLSVVRGIVDSHGGDISVESQPGVGSRFIIQLAAKRAPLEFDGDDHRKASPSPRLVLVVSDQSYIRNTIKTALTAEGVDVSAVTCADAEKLSWAFKQSTDAIVVDETLNRRVCTRLLENARKLNERCPMLLCADEACGDDLTLLDNVLVLQWPIPVDELSKLVIRMLG